MIINNNNNNDDDDYDEDANPITQADEAQNQDNIGSNNSNNSLMED